MSNGRYRSYYWEIIGLLAENEELLDEPNHGFLTLCEDEAFFGAMQFTVRFTNGYRLVVDSNLESNDAIRETKYYYGFYDANGARVFQYDDSGHHDHRTKPHDLHVGPVVPGERDPAQPVDIWPVNFRTVFRKIVRGYSD